MKRWASGGFTLVESMIVLAVTGVLFVSLAGMVSGQQAKARFKSSMTDITTQIQSQINEVTTGYYPNTGNFRCQTVAGNPVLSAGATAQGENSDCTFLGRAMMYGIPGTDPEQYVTQTLVGARRTLLGREPLTLQEARTQVLARGTVFNTVGSWPDQGTSKSLQHGTEVAWMRSRNGGGVNVTERIAGFAIVAAPNQQLTLNANSAVESGTIVPTIIPIPNPTFAPDPGVSARDGVDLLIRSLGVPPSGPSYTANAADGPIDICFVSGTTRQSGLVTIGTNNSSTSVQFIILNSQDCS